MAKLFIFGIGGTGARVIRSFTMMMASGFKNVSSNLEIVPIILDHDNGNGDLNRVKSLLDSYYGINKSMYPDAGRGNTVYEDAYFVPRVTALNQIGAHGEVQVPKWHVRYGATAADGNLSYSDYIGLSTISASEALAPTTALIEALYDDSPANSPNAELKLNLNKGFKGNPNIGTVVFNELRTDSNFRNFLNNCRPQDGDKVFVIGSIFGGTGSSGIPVIVDEIRNSRIGNVREVPIGVALVLPYFKLWQKSDENVDDTGAIDSSLFNAKTSAALGAYDLGGEHSFNKRVTDLYYIADTFSDTYDYHEGSNKQQNPAHVVEWVAATSIIDFLQLNDPYGTNRVREFGISLDDNSKAIDLTNLYPASKQQFMDDMTIFVMGMRYFDEVTCGKRNPINPTKSYYTTFDLEKKLKEDEGAYSKIKKFLNDNSWGFYKWIDELSNHDHSFRPYRMEGSGKDQKNVLSHKEYSGGLFSDSPLSDDTFSGKINQLSKNTADTRASGYFKALHDASKEIFKKLK